MRTGPSVAIVGAGPAGLMAAEVLAQGGASVDVFDAMASAGRKFLMAGKGGMNITHSEPRAAFLARYRERETQIAALIEHFPPQRLRDWMLGLGVESFVGSSGRVFPTDMKAAPLLRAWLARLRASGVRFHMHHRWLGWATDGHRLRFATPQGDITYLADALLLATGGGSWARLGSDGAWVPLLTARGVAVAPLKPANCGFDVGGPDSGWSAHFRQRFEGAPVKSLAARCEGDGPWRRGEFVVTASGVEGGLIYALSAPLREAIERAGRAHLLLDLLPDYSAERVLAEVARARGSRSLASHLQSRLGLKGVKVGLLRECLPASDFAEPARLAAAIKTLPLKLVATRPLDEAISSAGGVSFEALDAQLMLRAAPGVFCAGEMLDWEAPTGGYLLSACLASGYAAGLGVRHWLAQAKADESGRCAARL